MLEGYEAFNDPYVYKGTTVLKNRIGIRDRKTLEAFEVEMSYPAPRVSRSVAADGASWRRPHLAYSVFDWCDGRRVL